MQGSIANKFSQVAGTIPDDIRVTVVPASVQITVDILLALGSNASSVIAALKDKFISTQALPTHYLTPSHPISSITSHHMPFHATPCNLIRLRPISIQPSRIVSHFIQYKYTASPIQSN